MRFPNIVKCSTADGFFCENCYHAEPHEESPDCRYRMEAIVERRRRICNCLNGYTECREIDDKTNDVL
jgi:hypothetical protein